MGAPHSSAVPEMQALCGMQIVVQVGPYYLLGKKSSRDDMVTKTYRHGVRQNWVWIWTVSPPEHRSSYLQPQAQHLEQDQTHHRRLTKSWE